MNLTDIEPKCNWWMTIYGLFVSITTTPVKHGYEGKLYMGDPPILVPRLTRFNSTYSGAGSSVKDALKEEIIAGAFPEAFEKCPEAAAYHRLWKDEMKPEIIIEGNEDEYI